MKIGATSTKKLSKLENIRDKLLMKYFVSHRKTWIASGIYLSLFLAFYDWVIGVSSPNVLKNMLIICYCLKTRSLDCNYEAIEVNVSEKSF